MAPETEPQVEPLADFDGALRYLVEHSDLSPNQARALIERCGTEDRAVLMAAARTMKAEG